MAKWLDSLLIHTQLTCLFLQSAVRLFEDVNVILQKDEPCIHMLHAVLLQQLQSILMRFVKPSLIAALPSLTSVQYKDKENHKDDIDVTIGTAAKEFIGSNEAQLHSRLRNFYGEAKEFYVRACKYMTSKFPYNDPLLVNAQVADISKRHEASFHQLKYFTDRFECLLPDSCTKDQLEEEFLAYQYTVLPTAVTEADRIDVAWHCINNIKDPGTGNYKFSNLCAIVKGILVIFHSNADSERIFSLVISPNYECHISTRLHL